METTSSNFLVLPYPGFGHIIPLLELSRKIVAAKHHVVFAVSENLLTDMRNRQMFKSDEEPAIRFVGLKDGIHHPPEDALSIAVFEDLNEKLSVSLENFLEKIQTKNEPIYQDETDNLQVVNVLIVDLNLGVIPFRIAHRRNIPAVAFAAFAGHTLVQMLQVNEDTPTAPDEHLLKATKPGTIIESWKKQLLETQRGLLLSDMLLINSFAVLEPSFDMDLVTLCPKFAHLKCRFIGLILPSNQEVNEGHHSELHQVRKWLDNQREKSVLYVSFGSIAYMDSQQIIELSKALKGSQRPFIWSLRSAQQQYLPSDIRDSIKRQFDDAGAPNLVLHWAPQKQILRHKSTRVFISHCGWNSTMESISAGVPIVAWPMFADQHGNADLVEKMGCGVKIQQVDMSTSGQRIVGCEEILDILGQVAQWTKPLSTNRFYITTQNLANEACEALQIGGSSARDFASLLHVTKEI